MAHRIAALLVAMLLAGPGVARPQTPPGTLDPARAAAAGLPRLHSMLVSWQGRTTLEYYGRGVTASRPANVKSASKSVLSALIGIAIERRLLRLDEPIVQFFPQLRQDADPRKARITIRDLLTMESGLASTSFDSYGAWVTSRNWVDFVLRRPLEASPGEVMEYSTGNSHLLSAILTRATRTSTWAFAQEQLARPLGFTLNRWPRDPQGIYFGGNDMLLTPRQMLAFGELYLHDGRVRERQIVPSSWVAASCTGRGRSRFNPDQTYGYGWWQRVFAGRDGCFAWGYGGQYIIIFKDLDLVIVTTSATTANDERRDHRRQIFDIVERLIVPAIAGQHDRAAAVPPRQPPSRLGQ